jgi:uncharacterized protein (TIGR02118 family)
MRGRACAESGDSIDQPRGSVPIQSIVEGERAMASLVALYRTPADPDAFNAYYFSTHIPLAKTIPGLRRYEVSSGPVVTQQGPSPYHLVGTLHFDSMAAIQHALTSREGQATAADLANFAQAGVEIVIFDSRDV